MILINDLFCAEKCDGIMDCSSGSDEWACPCDEFSCACKSFRNSSVCIDKASCYTLEGNIFTVSAYVLRFERAVVLKLLRQLRVIKFFIKRK